MYIAWVVVHCSNWLTGTNRDKDSSSASQLLWMASLLQKSGNNASFNNLLCVAKCVYGCNYSHYAGADAVALSLHEYIYEYHHPQHSGPAIISELQWHSIIRNSG